MTNFLAETRLDIRKSGHKIKDIVFIGSKKSGHRCSWRQFVKLANFDYYSGFGSQKIAGDLIIAFSDGQTMWRGEFDGSEWWEYSTPFKMPKKNKPITTLSNGDMWATLAEMNRPGGKYDGK